MERPPPAESRGKILLADDAPANLAVLTGALEPEGYEVFTVASGEVALKIAARVRPDLILLDVLMPGLDGLQTCRRLKEDETTREIPVIFITARNEMTGLVEGFRAGAVDYIVKPFQAEEVLSRVATHLRLSRLARELIESNRALEQRAAELAAEIERRQRAETALQNADDTLSAISNLEADRWKAAGWIGSSGAARRIIGEIHRLRQFPTTSVLITGESGTGKELVARAIHFDGARARAPFVPVNCVAIPAELAESMLFGHLKGSFTGATSDRKGYFELAHGGTLFLDEIGDMSVSLQVKLLRVLEDGCIQPLGSPTARKIDVRVIAATNADLADRIASGAFRQDLYFRLARYVVATVPLRERLEDMPPLVEHFCRTLAPEMGLKSPTISPAALKKLQTYDFPGNVRELRNIIERALIEGGGERIEPAHLYLMSREPGAVAVPRRPVSVPLSTQELPLNLAEAEDLLIQRALQETGGNIADAARLLGVHRTRIYRNLARGESPSD